MPEELFARVKTYPRFERGWNRLQMAIEILVALIVLSGLLGLFGTGPLSSATATGPNAGVGIDYERILRRTVETEMKIGFGKPVLGPRLNVLLPHAFLADMSVVSTSPRAAAMLMEKNGVTYVFEVGASGLGVITLSLKPKGVGLITSPFVVQGEPIVLHQFIFP